MNQLLSKFQVGFRKGYNTQYCLLAMLGKWKCTVDRGKFVWAYLRNSKGAGLSFSRTDNC